ncbi:MAG TPA: hypothetical protein VJ715_09975 [Pyrinomonadaceae bacterium]|nr:hypothetical protein [Pyrinomonadaceae bacterium]
MLLSLVLAAASPAVSQQDKLKINKHGQLEITPEMAEKARRRGERLRDPSFIKLEIEPISNCQDEEAKKIADCYKAHGKVVLNLLMTNTSSESIKFAIGSPYWPNSLQLFRDGELVPYRKDTAEIADKPPVALYNNYSVELKPGKTQVVGVISLAGWYEPLEPGHYQLDIKRRFLLDGGWTNTASTTFEVEPE